MNTLTTWAASLALALFIGAAGGLMDGPSDFDAAIDSQSATQDAIDSVATSQARERAEGQFNPLLAVARQ